MRRVSLRAQGEHVEADIIVSATGIELLNLGGADFIVDGKSINFADEWTYKGGYVLQHSQHGSNVWLH
jgi:cation diffusion facilitator CzcD-associated flavoprotein CzcO